LHLLILIELGGIGIKKILFALLFICLRLSVNDLDIIGPSEAFEGESVEFLIKLDGKPVQARVTFNQEVKYSNATSGKVVFTMPFVPYNGKEYFVNASVPGEIFAQHSIFVKNKTKVLEIELPDYVMEMDEFTMKVKAGDKPVRGASVWFNSRVYTSDIHGNVAIKAPDVLVTTSYGVFVNKTGYKSNSTMVTIKECNKGMKLMEIICPLIVEPGKDDVEVKVVSKQGGLENVSVELYYENSRHSYKTDYNGIAYIKTPSIRNDNYFFLEFWKDGYLTYNEEKIKINLMTRDLKPLKIVLAQSEVNEGEGILVQVTDEEEEGIEGVTIWRGETRLDRTTDREGILEFSAPAVFMDRELFIYALKEGYSFAEGKLTVRDIVKGRLKVEVKSRVNESEIFFVRIKDKEPLEGVTVSFNFQQKITNESGIVYFMAPNVTGNTFFTIEASKHGYQPSSISIEIADADTPKKLRICVVPFVKENERFTVIVRDEGGNTISNARVKFMDTILYTDFQGYAIFKAPSVNWDTKYDILVTKSGYESSLKEITIKDSGEFQYWYLVLAIILIFIIGALAHYKYRYKI
jgi:hypothetical protein